MHAFASDRLVEYKPANNLPEPELHRDCPHLLSPSFFSIKFAIIQRQTCASS